ncbi:response regulator transcription factor [Variovorax sp. J22R115]|uniref:response regulator transcription factor n=1 Tax=Variovorax sp. J22R115 TaxID=3053509 RepID=UPI00257703CE|nr:LuxR C-terminal-related transcriptional regulator [Variovorax sp. J22R115]MDM0049727.1 LuxR C-terminal-related transcriptional regulator [Variovorax sp. J22R115]
MLAVVQLIGSIAIARQLSRSLHRQGHRVHASEDLKEFATQGPAARPEVGCVLVDIDVPENLSALPGFLAYAAVHGVATVVLATRPEPVDIIAAMKVGVSDFLIRPVAEQVLRETIQTAIVRGRTLRSRASRIAFLKGRFGSLTYQEQLVARFVSEGHRNRAIAEKLGVAERTVKNHRKLALQKLAVDSVPGLVHAMALLGFDGPHGGASFETEEHVQGPEPSRAAAALAHPEHPPRTHRRVPRSRKPSARWLGHRPSGEGEPEK